MALIQNGKLTVASLGDSVCTIVRKDRSHTKLSEDHNASRTDERERILNNKNGFILANNRVQGELTITRAIGNINHKSVIISEPETVQYVLSPIDDLLVLSTDGLFNSFTQEHLVNRIFYWRAAGYNLAQITDKIIEECLGPGFKKPNDNVTLVIVDIAAYYLEHVRSRVQSPKQTSSRTQSPSCHLSPQQHSFKLRQMTSEAG